MKRHVIAAVIIGLIVGGLVIALSLLGWLAAPESAINGLLPETTARIPAVVQYLLVVIAATGVAFLTVATAERSRMGLIVAALVAEIAVVAWVFALYTVGFSPLPLMLAVLLAYGGVLFHAWLSAYLEERRSRVPKIEAGPTPRPAPISVAAVASE